MRKLLIFLVVICLVLLLTEAPQAFAQAQSSTTLKAGYFKPKGIDKSGFIFGGNYAWVVDEAVDIGIAVDYFRKSFTEQTSFQVEGEQVVQTDSIYSTNILPIYGIINVKFPAGTYLDYFISGGLGYEFLFRKEINYLENGDENKKTKSYGGFKWLVSAGIMYRVGSRSSFLAEVFYDGAKVSRDRKVANKPPQRYEVDLSGIGFRVGVRMGFH